MRESIKGKFNPDVNPVRDAIRARIDRDNMKVDEFAKKIGVAPTSLRAWLTKKQLPEDVWRTLQSEGIIPPDAEPELFGYKFTTPRRKEKPLDTLIGLLSEKWKIERTEISARPLDDQRAMCAALLRNEKFQESFDRFVNQPGGKLVIVKPFATWPDQRTADSAEWDASFTTAQQGHSWGVDDARKDVASLFGSQFFLQRARQFLEADPTHTIHLIIPVDEAEHIEGVKNWLDRNMQEQFGSLSQRIRLDVILLPSNIQTNLKLGIWLHVPEKSSVGKYTTAQAWRMFDLDQDNGEILHYVLPDQGMQNPNHVLATTSFHKLEDIGINLQNPEDIVIQALSATYKRK